MPNRGNSCVDKWPVCAIVQLCTYGQVYAAIEFRQQFDGNAANDNNCGPADHTAAMRSYNNQHTEYIYIFNIIYHEA